MLKQKLKILAISTLLFAPAILFAADKGESESLAIVDGEVISYKEFQSALQAGMKKRFYHGKIPEEQLEAFKKEVSQSLIDRVLLVQEAKRQNLKPDEKRVSQQLAEYEKRYESKPFWKEHKQDVLKGLRAALEEESVLEVLENNTKNVALPSEKDAKIFYEKNPDLFTTPEKVRVSVILLKVSPSSPADVWQAANKEALDIIDRLNKGADFAELARIHSGDETAGNGGEMGFVHKGMLAKPAQLALDKINVGQISEPVMLLRGIGIFKLDEKQDPALNAFDAVAERARKLLQRENSNLAWTDLLEKLRAQANIEINTAALSTIKKS